MMVDFHTHILPCMDDGSKSLNESIEMLLKESEFQVSDVVLTPHFYPMHDDPKAFLERREKAYQTLHEEVKKYPYLPKLHVGAEVYYFDGISSWEGLKDFAISNTSYVLIEMPMAPWSNRMFKELENIKINLGLTPIIAHLDRYIKPLKTYRIPSRLKELDVIVQANSSFFLKSTTQRLAYKLLRQGMIHVVGSDCHNMTSRPPNLWEAFKKIEQKLGKEMIEAINACGKDILE